jgi:hypothetical protein
LKIVVRITFIFLLCLCVIFIRTENSCAGGRKGEEWQKMFKLNCFMPDLCITDDKQSQINFVIKLKQINSNLLTTGTKLSVTLNVKL